MSLIRVLSLSLLLASAPAVAQDKQSLRLEFAPGTVAHYLTTQDMNMDMSMGGQPMGTTMSMQMFTTMKIKEVKDGVATIEQTVTRVTATVKSPMMGNTDYDSDDEDSDPGMLEDLADMVGKTLTARIDDTGKLVDMEKPKGAARGGQSFDSQQMFTQAFAQLPKEPVAVGGTWQSSIEMPLGQMGKSEVEVGNKLLALDGKVATIEQTMRIDMDALELPEEMKMEVKNATGTSKLDLGTGLPKETSVAMDMVMDGGPMKMTMKTRVTMKQVPAPEKKPEAPTTGPKGDAKEAAAEKSGETGNGGN